MVLDPKKATIVYHCPECLGGVTGLVGMFTLSGDMFRLKCPCGCSEATLSRASDGKVRLTVPCIVCPNPHNYTVSESVFFSNELFVLSCPYTGMDICFIGEEKAVSKAYEDSSRELQKLLEEVGVAPDVIRSDVSEDELFDDTMIEEIIRFMIAELQDEGNITCNCTEDTFPSYDFEFMPPDYENIRIFCRKCGAEKIMPMTSVSQAQDLLEVPRIDLK